MNSSNYKVLILGASYGSLLSTKLLLAGHRVTLVCTAGTAKQINQNGTEVMLPVKGRDGLVSLHSTEISQFAPSSNLDAAIPDNVDPASYDLVVLGMQEPQYSSEGVRDLLVRVARSRIPTLAIMNMPPLPFLRRFKDISIDSLKDCYAEPELWDEFEPGLVTLASPDPQAFRPDDAEKNVLQVSLPTNFKVARFESQEHTDMLTRMQSDIESIRWPLENGETTELPVKLKVFDSLFVPLAKWSMLMTGNYRCVEETGMRAIKDAVHANLEESKGVYEWVVSLCVKMGADAADMVPFEKYAKAASGLAMKNASVDQSVKFVDARLDINNTEASNASQIDQEQAVVGSN